VRYEAIREAFSADALRYKVLQHFAEELGLKFVFDKLPHDSMATFRVESTGSTSLIDHFAVSQ